MDELLREFLTETGESIDVVDVQLVRFEQDPNDAKILDNIFRLVHTIKGTCGFLNLPRLEALAHAAEALMDRFRDGVPVTREAVTLVLATVDRIKAMLVALERDQGEPTGDDNDLIGQLNGMAALAVKAPPTAPPEITAPEPPAFAALGHSAAVATTAAPIGDPTVAMDQAVDDRSVNRVATHSIRVHIDTLEELMTTVSELVLTRNQLLEIGRRHEDSEFKGPLQRLSSVTAELQDSVMKTRMQPIGNAWQKLPRIVRDLSSELGKPIELEMHGANTELDRQVLDLIKDPLIHMVRNAADHGLELPSVRRAAGKPEKGMIRLSSRHEGGHIIIEIADDGRGLNTEQIKAAAIGRGLVAPADADAMSEAQIHKFIFAPGFSTVTHVTNVSGRGVGMDVVRNNIEEIGGTIDVSSVFGRGSKFAIKIPLTLAIVSALIVEAGGDRFAVPQLAVVELVRVRSNSEHRIERIKDAAVLRLRDRLLPLIDFKEMLKIERKGDADLHNGFIVVMQVGSQMFGIVVDGVFHTEEIVVKPMASKLRHISVFSGTTILGDGSVIMIVDPNGIAQTVVGTGASRLGIGEHAGATGAASQAQTESMLVFRAGSPQPKAVLLALVTRLEEIDARKIEFSNGRPMVQYRGQLMPLVPVNDEVRIRNDGVQPILVFSNEGRSMGLVVDEIVDIVEDTLDIEIASECPGVVGSAVIKGQATDVVDVGHFLPLAYDDWTHWRDRTGGAAARNVLLIDDAPFFRNMLAPMLKAAGYAVTAVGSAEEALTLVADGRRFDVVVTDTEMPGMDGFALASALHRHPLATDTCIIGMASMVSSQAIERGRQAGFHDFVAKFDRQGLIAALKEQTAEMSRAA